MNRDRLYEDKQLKYNILKEEYFRILDIIFHFDNLAFKIKAALFITVTTLTGIIVRFDFNEGIFVIIILTFLFWLIEATLKSFQYLNYFRLREISRYMRGELTSIHLLQATEKWYKGYQQNFVKTFCKSLLRFYVGFPYIIIISSAIYFYWENLSSFLGAICIISLFSTLSLNKEGLCTIFQRLFR